MSTSARIIKNTGFLYAKMGITMFISLYTTRLILNALGASDFGIFNIVGGAIAMLGFLNAAMASATQRFMSYSEGEGNKEKQKQIFNISFVLHFVIAIVVGIVLFIAGWFFFHGILNIAPERMFAAKVVYGSLIVSTVFTVMTVPYDAVLNAHENMLYYSIVGILESLLKLGAALLVVYYAHDKLVLYGILMACIPLITLSIMRFYCNKHYEECVLMLKSKWNRSLLREMFGFASWNMISTAMVMLSSYGQGIILNHFFGTILNAAQGIANQLSGQLMSLIQNLFKALNPVIDKSAGANDKILFNRTVFLGAKMSFILYSFISFPVIVLAPQILSLWLKNVPEWSIIFVQLQLIQKFIGVIFTTLPNAINAKGNIKGYTIIMTFSNIFQLPFLFLLFKCQFPPYFMYVTGIFFGNFIPAVGALYLCQKLCGIKALDYLKFVIYPALISSTVFVLILLLIKFYFLISSIYNVFIYILIAVILNVFISYYITCDKDDRILFKRLFKNFIMKYV